MDDTKKYAIALTNDAVKGFVGGAIVAFLVIKFVRHNKSNKEEA